MNADGAASPAPPHAATISEADAAKYLGDFSVSYLQKKRCYGGGPAYVRIGRVIRYRVADLDEFLLKHRVPR